jgi:hypothetical protein
MAFFALLVIISSPFSFCALARRPIPKEVFMAYSFTNSKGVTYILHSKDTVLKSGRTQTLYFFAKEQKEGALDAVPAGYQVAETKNGLPVLKKA